MTVMFWLIMAAAAVVLVLRAWAWWNGWDDNSDQGY